MGDVEWWFHREGGLTSHSERVGPQPGSEVGQGVAEKETCFPLRIEATEPKKSAALIVLGAADMGTLLNDGQVRKALKYAACCG